MRKFLQLAVLSIVSFFVSDVFAQQTTVNFDDVTRGCFFGSMPWAGTEYASENVVFSGTFQSLSECGGFTVTNYSSPNFLAWNIGSTGNTEDFLFANPIGSFSFFIASGTPQAITVSAFNSSGSLLSTQTPSISSTGTTVSFTHSGIARVTLVVSNAGVIDNLVMGSPSPVAIPQTVDLDEDNSIQVTLTGVDPQHDPLNFALTVLPNNGQVTNFDTATGTLIYTPAPNFNGVDSFSFTVSDGTHTSQPAVVTLQVAPIDDAPTTTNDSFDTNEDTTAAFNLNGDDVDGDTLTFAIVSSPTHGLLSVDAATGAVSYVPT